jgi:hypothetical protein
MPKRKAKSENQVSIDVSDVRDVSGEINIAAGDINQTFNTIHQRALTAAEEAARARKLESKLLARGVSKLAWGLAGQVSDSLRKGLLSYSLNQVGVFYKRNETKRGSFE